ncbi:MAG: HIT family protein [Kosmotogaceae bacterium]|nr:HIT family protein [Kosmotogaceae bacterium]
MIERCIFCDIAGREEMHVFSNDLIFGLNDKTPVTKGHMLLIPKRHVESYFDLTEQEMVEIGKALKDMKRLIDREYGPDGYNVGVNVGKGGGQTIFHVHVHLIPRYLGDVENPVGGVRNVIPNKGNYKKKTLF